jgi:selenocysteine-specific elongation factor
VVLESPVPVLRGDHCVIRTSNETAAGGRIVAVNPRRHRRNHAPTLAALERQLAGSPAERLVDLLASGPLPPDRARQALAMELADMLAATSEAVEAGLLCESGGVLVSTAWLESAIARLVDGSRAFLAVNPLRAGAPREHLRSASALEPAIFDIVVAEAMAAGRLKATGANLLAPPDHEARLTPAQQAQADSFLTALKEGGASPPTEHLPPPPMLAYLSEQGLVEDTGAGVVFDSGTFAEMTSAVRAHLASRESISLAEVRDLFGTSRKYAQAFLEHLDALRITRRVGDARVLR